MWKYPSSIRCRDSNPQSLGGESPPLTTRPRIPLQHTRWSTAPSSNFFISVDQLEQVRQRHGHLHNEWRRRKKVHSRHWRWTSRRQRAHSSAIANGKFCHIQYPWTYLSETVVRPYIHEYSPITTRPRLPLNLVSFLPLAIFMSQTNAFLPRHKPNPLFNCF